MQALLRLKHDQGSTAKPHSSYSNCTEAVPTYMVSRTQFPVLLSLEARLGNEQRNPLKGSDQELWFSGHYLSSTCNIFRRMSLRCSA